MKKHFTFLFMILASISLWSQSDIVSIEKDPQGQKLLINDKPMLIKGMNWDYLPIGTNYSYNFWQKSDDFIQKALDDEMSLLQNMGVNSIRVYTGIPKKWIEYIYTNYGIYTMLNHPFGRYGLTIDGNWIPNTDYADEKTRATLLKEVSDLVNEYKDTKGLLLFLLGNENNYGLFWDGAETEDIPVKDRKSTSRAYAMYKLFNEAAIQIKSLDKNHPVALCNGDLLFLDIISKMCPNFDILGCNVYRGVSFTDFFDRVKNEYDKPVLFTEFGSDAFNAKSNQEDQAMQAYYLRGNWKEIYDNAYGVGKAGNCIGGYTFQFSDGWWKYGQTKNLDIHDNNASWSNGGYQKDFVKGSNNMNEEWFGICSKGPVDASGHYTLYPRAAYYVLRDIHKFDPITSGNTLSSVEQHFRSVNTTDATLRARGDKAASTSSSSDKIRLSRLSGQFTTFSTGGSLITTPTTPAANNTEYPDKLGFDHMQSFFVGVEANPSSNFRANVDFNILGNVASNPIDQIFYENRGRPMTINTPNGPVVTQDNNRVQLYSASYQWNHEWFNMDGFYRTGHYHWMYEGDFFGLYPEANYGPNMDIYNGAAPFGMEFEGKKALSGFKAAFGPELWWGANPAVLLKYRREFNKGYSVTGVFHEDITQREAGISSFAVPQPKTRRATLHIEKKFKNGTIDIGGIWAGSPLNGRDIQVQRGTDENPIVFNSKIDESDNWGGKAKVTFSKGAFNWYASSAIQGLVANGGADLTQTFTGWRLKDVGSGNQMNFLTGMTFQTGNLQIGPNFLWQRPLEGPITSMTAPARPRNILQDPFVVRANREQIAGEILLTFDPTPATWMYQWDNDRTEDAKLAFNLGFVYRHLPTQQDAAVGFLANRTMFAFPGSAPAQDLWEVHSRIVSKVNSNLGFIANIFGGTAQANGSDARLLERFGGDLRVVYNKVKVMYACKFNDWGPFDYHRDFNLTFPMQQILDLSTELGKPDWFLLPTTKIGIMGTYRTLNKYSPRYNPTQTLNAAGVWVPNPNAVGFPDGNEWEIRTYVHFNIGK